MKVEIQAEGCFFLCSLEFLLLLFQDKRRLNTRSCKLRVTFFETKSSQTTPALRATLPERRASKDKGQSSKDKVWIVLSGEC
jgi:hypothetical protein